ncbi:MAG: hypothetical protein HPM95_09535 [Alphaproteobacteria bacterium]|nr:hypothetical protein [Alphaproteobacteria bacterium]
MHPRLYLISPIDLDPDSFPQAVEAALSGGDVACPLIADGGLGRRRRPEDRRARCADRPGRRYRRAAAK